MEPYVMKTIVMRSLFHVDIQRKNKKKEEEKEVIYLPKVQEGKEDTIFTRKQEEIIYIREVKEE
jgi:hypothetical protein